TVRAEGADKVAVTVPTPPASAMGLPLRLRVTSAASNLVVAVRNNTAAQTMAGYFLRAGLSRGCVEFIFKLESPINDARHQRGENLHPASIYQARKPRGKPRSCARWECGTVPRGIPGAPLRQKGRRGLRPSHHCSGCA